MHDPAERDAGFMREALIEADRALMAGEVPVGAVLVIDGEVLARAHNRTRELNDPTAHAEVCALRTGAAATSAARLDGATLYVTLEPCLMCSGALLQARIARLVFGAREPRCGAVVSVFDALMAPGHTHRVAISEGICEADCGLRMTRYFSSRRGA